MKIFIYNGQGAGKESRQDLHTFFSTHGKEIFSRKPDITDINLNSIPSFDGLEEKDNVTLVVSGGRADVMAKELQPLFAKFPATLKCNYLGVCAATFAAVAIPGILHLDPLSLIVFY